MHGPWWLWPLLVLAALVLMSTARRVRRAQIRRLTERPCFTYDIPLRGSPRWGYAGMGWDWQARVRCHREKWWWRHVDESRIRVIRHPSRAAAKAHEDRMLAADPPPRFNVAGVRVNHRGRGSRKLTRAA